MAWTPGKHTKIDESVICYMGRVVSYVQYMPQKPIKHGIKVFALCCGYTAVLLLFIVYVGEEDDSNNSALKVYDKLCVDAGIISMQDRVLYTDNYYTSVKLAKHMFKKYGWTIVGTVVPTDKKSISDEDIPFLKLSNGARKMVNRGWLHEAYLKLKIPNGKVYYIQCRTWRDKKQVKFISNCEVGFSNSYSVKRHVRGKRYREIINGPRAQAEYIKFMNAVDKNNRYSANFSTSIWTNRYYIRIFYWGLYMVVHTEYFVVCFLARKYMGNPERKKYLKRMSACHNFYIDLAIALLKYGIGLEWGVKDDSKRPDYMTREAFVPCACNFCLHCINVITSGIAHSGQNWKVAVVHYQCGKAFKTEECT